MQEGARHDTFMRENVDQDPAPDLSERLHLIVDEMLKPFGKESIRLSGLGRGPPFDISKPNFHDSKAEFLLEKRTIEGSMERIKTVVLDLFVHERNEDQHDMLETLGPMLDLKMRGSVDRRGEIDALQLVRMNVADIGGFNASLHIMVDLFLALKERASELKAQEEEFWDLRHRPPDYFGRAIAHRLAKLYVRETGKRPTTGTSPDSGEPSTGYTRALKKVFEELDVSTGIRTHAEWAVGQITEEDFQKPLNALAGAGLLGSMVPNRLATLLTPEKGEES